MADDTWTDLTKNEQMIAVATRKILGQSVVAIAKGMGCSPSMIDKTLREVREQSKNMDFFEAFKGLVYEAMISLQQARQEAWSLYHKEEVSDNVKPQVLGQITGIDKFILGKILPDLSVTKKDTKIEISWKGDPKKEQIIEVVSKDEVND